MQVKRIYDKMASDAQQERAFMSALGFTSAFAGCRGVTHAIRRGIPPFHNFSSKGGTHIHHSTFGIFGMLGIGTLWAQQIFTGHDEPPRYGSATTSLLFGMSAALTLDEFALWLDLHDDYWDAKGRKSVDAAIIFGGLLTTLVAASEALEDLGYMPRVMQALEKLDVRRRLAASVSPGAGGAAGPPTSPNSGDASAQPASAEH